MGTFPIGCRCLLSVAFCGSFGTCSCAFGAGFTVGLGRAMSDCFGAGGGVAGRLIRSGPESGICFSSRVSCSARRFLSARKRGFIGFFSSFFGDFSSGGSSMMLMGVGSLVDAKSFCRSKSGDQPR